MSEQGPPNPPVPTAAPSAPARRPDSAGRVVLKDLWRTFFVDPVRENVVRSHGGGPTARSMVLLGVVAFALAAWGVVRAAAIGATPVGPGSAVLGSTAAPGLPVTIPVYFFPAFVTLVLVSTFVGAFGAVYARPVLAVLALSLIVLATLPSAGFAWGFRDFTWWAYLALPAALALPVVVLVLRLVTPSPPVVQAVTCAAALLAVVPSALAQVSAYTQGGVALATTLMAQQTENLVGMLAAVVTPAVLLAGAGAVSFGRTVTDFLARAVDVLSARNRLAFLVVLLVLLAWRILATLVSLAQDEHTGPAVAKMLLLSTVLVAAAGWWSWATRGFDETPDEVEEGAGKGVLPTALLLLAILLLPTLLQVLGYVAATVTSDLGLLRVALRVIVWTGHDWVSVSWYLAVGAVLVAWAVYEARVRPSVAAAWVGIAGAITLLVLVWNSVVPERTWGHLTRDDYAHAALLVITVATVRELLRWRAERTPPRPGWTLTAFSALALTALVAQGSFLDDPFRPLLGFTGLGLVFFGLVWGFLTAGAHSSVHGMAGLGRTLVMLAYAVLTTTLLAWGDATGDMSDSVLSGSIADTGKTILGGALLVSLLAVWIPILFGLADPAVRAEPTPDPAIPPPEAGGEPTLSA